MNSSNASKFFKTIQTSLAKHSPEILTGLGIAGMITTTVLAVKATPKAMELIKEESRANHDGDPNAYTKKEAFKSAWKCYIPAAITGVSSIACLIGANSIHAKRGAALATAYKISETALTEYREKTLATVGEKKEQAIRDKIAEDRIKKNPVSTNEVYITEKGNTLCHDALSDRYFMSDIEQIKKAVNELNRQLLLDMYISLNELYDALGLNHTSIGDDLGWNIDDGLIEIIFSPQLADDGRPCLSLDYRIAPKYNFANFS